MTHSLSIKTNQDTLSDKLRINYQNNAATRLGQTFLLPSLSVVLLLGSCSTEKAFLTDDVTQVGSAEGIRWGVATLKESGPEWNLGTGSQSYSVAAAYSQTGYFYAQKQSLPVSFANFVGGSPCDPASDPGDVSRPGYQGVASVSELTDVKALSFDTQNILFGTRESQCYTGMLVFHQGDFYGVIDPVSMDQAGTLQIKWWAGAPGVTDFSKAPVDPTKP